MDQVKIGKFISECRKKQNLTQSQLAEKLGITDRAISKWETGRTMPDSSLMLDLCNILKISVNELLNGEAIVMNQVENKQEELLLDMVKQKEESDKRLLNIEIILGILSLVPLLSSIIVVVAIPMEEWKAAIVVLASLIPFLVAVPFLINIEQKAGYYECSECGYKYIPKYKSVFMARHIGRTRKMKCPKCDKKCWHKKVIGK